jgi:hypothetical protein
MCSVGHVTATVLSGNTNASKAYRAAVVVIPDISKQ